MKKVILTMALIASAFFIGRNIGTAESVAENTAIESTKGDVENYISLKDVVSTSYDQENNLVTITTKTDSYEFVPDTRNTHNSQTLK